MNKMGIGKSLLATATTLFCFAAYAEIPLIPDTISYTSLSISGDEILINGDGGNWDTLSVTGCGSGFFVSLDTSHARFDELYAMIIVAIARDLQIQPVVNGCADILAPLVNGPGVPFNVPVITGINIYP